MAMFDAGFLPCRQQGDHMQAVRLHMQLAAVHADLAGHKCVSLLLNNTLTDSCPLYMAKSLFGTSCNMQADRHVPNWAHVAFLGRV